MTPESRQRRHEENLIGIGLQAGFTLGFALGALTAVPAGFVCTVLLCSGAASWTCPDCAPDAPVHAEAAP